MGAAYHLTQQCPDKSFVVLEGLESFGGTWLIHRYPGIRSDSDLYTFGYRFKPWIDPENFNPGYLMRSMHLMPKRGDKPEWQHTQDYWLEKNELPKVNLDASEFVYV